MKIILLSGGSGKRLWPYSNGSRTKQFLKVLEGPDGGRESMVQRVWRQLQESGLADSTYIATCEAQVSLIKSQLGENVPLIVEPERRDTFPAIALISAYLHTVIGASRDEIVCVLPVDPYVENDFFDKVKELKAVLLETDTQVALIGSRPTYPSGKYGYILPDDKALTKHKGSMAIKSFVEKPSESEAALLIESGALWNCGIFAFKLGYLLSLLQDRNYPTSYKELMSSYHALPRNSFDYEVLEKAERLRVVVYERGWKDLGTWNTLTEEMGTKLIGRGLISEDSINTHVLNELDILVTVLGLSNVIVAVSQGGILVSDKAASPRIKELMHAIEQKQISDHRIREMNIKDLIGREMINDESLVNAESYLKGKVVLVTGAGGSIGGELVNQVAQCSPDCILLLGHGENSIHSIEGVIREKYPNLAVRSIIADIQNAKEVEDVFAKYSPSVVFHAAAHKHVPLMENNPSAAVRNNVFGTLNVVEQAVAAGVERFVFISTDKAVEPINIMGMTKRLAEMIIQTKSQRSATTFSIVRFGNVLESRGSVIPIFKKQIAAGGPVTVTHPDMVRYFMTIPEAVHLVLQAGSLSKGGEIFVLDMGKPVKIVDVAKALIRFAGHDPEHDVKIVFTGMRPGEKLSESLFYGKEQMMTSQHPRIFIASPQKINEAKLQADLKNLEAVMNQAPEQLRDSLEEMLKRHALEQDEEADEA